MLPFRSGGISGAPAAAGNGPPWWLRWGMVALCLGEAWWWTDGWGSHSALLSLPTPGVMCVRISEPRAIVFDGPAGLRLGDSFADERNGREPGPEEHVRAELWCSVRTSTGGLWAPAFARIDHRMGVVPGPGALPLTGEELSAMRGRLASWFAPGGRWAGYGDAESASLFASGDGTDLRVRWGWLLHDIAIAVGAVWTGRAWVRRRARERAARHRDRCGAAECCISCGYSVRGLRGDGPCPECGELRLQDPHD